MGTLTRCNQGVYPPLVMFNELAAVEVSQFATREVIAKATAPSMMGVP